MAFGFYKSQVEPNSPTTIVLPTTASETYKVGELLKLASGKLTKASGTDTPAFVSQADYVAPAAGNKGIQVTQINHDQWWIAPLQASGASLKVGDKVTVHTDGLQVTATTTNGVAEIIEIDGTAVGDTVKVRF